MSVSTRYQNGVLTVTQVFDAPREAVFSAWVETSKVEQWWGCADTTKVSSTIEAKCGGRYDHDMTINGDIHCAKAVITEYDPPARLSYRMVKTDFSPEMSVNVLFEVEGAGTRVTLTHAGIPDPLSEVIKGGWTAAFGKLEKFLAPAST